MCHKRRLRKFKWRKRYTYICMWNVDIYSNMWVWNELYTNKHFTHVRVHECRFFSCIRSFRVRRKLSVTFWQWCLCIRTEWGFFLYCRLFAIVFMIFARMLLRQVAPKCGNFFFCFHFVRSKFWWKKVLATLNVALFRILIWGCLKALLLFCWEWLSEIDYKNAKFGL